MKKIYLLMKKSDSVSDRTPSEDKQSLIFEESKKNPMLGKIDSNSVWIKEESKYDANISKSEEGSQQSVYYEHNEDESNRKSYEDHPLTKCILAKSASYKSPKRPFTTIEHKLRSCGFESIRIESSNEIKEIYQESKECNYAPSLKSASDTLNLKIQAYSNRSNESLSIEDEFSNPIMKIVDSIDTERKIQQNSSQQDEESISESSKIGQFRRRGALRERRFSKIDLGKQLAFYLK